MTAYSQELKDNPVFHSLSYIPYYFMQPVRLAREYDLSNWRADVVAGLTVGVIVLPQGIAFSLIAELPPHMGLYAAIVGAIVGGLWGSSNQMVTGPANAISILVLSALLTTATPGSREFLIAAGLLAVMVGLMQLIIGLARLGVLVNFVSHSVIVGFTAGAGVLIMVKQLRSLFGLEFPGRSLAEIIYGVAVHLPETHWATAVLGLGTIVLIVLLQKIAPKIPAPLVGMVIASLIVFFMGLDQAGVDVIGQLPRELPPLASLPLFNLRFISELSAGALAVGAIGLVESAAIARSIAAQTGQRLDSNQEFVGQGLANIACGVFSGYPGAGSFSRSAVNFKAGARTPLSTVISGLFVLVAMFVLAPLAAYLPSAALAGVLIVTAYGLIDWSEMAHIWRGARGDAIIMLVTFLGTMFLHIEIAVLIGILFSFAFYIMKTSVPRVYPVLPDEAFKHFTAQQPSQTPCPQLAIIRISGDLYFGAVKHVEERILKYLANNPEQRFLLLRMEGVNQCDISGVYMLESLLRICEERDGDMFLTKVQGPVDGFMQATGFYERLGADHFLDEDQAISHIFYRVLDPAICIYECNVRAFWECQNLPKRTYPLDIPPYTAIPPDSVPSIPPRELWHRLLHDDSPPLVIDVREPREFERGHVPHAQLLPLAEVIANSLEIPPDTELVFVCHAGRRSLRAAHMLQKKGWDRVQVLQGGMLAWEAAGLLEGFDQMHYGNLSLTGDENQHE